MNETKRTKVCAACSKSGRLKWLPCSDHGLTIPREFCGHEFTSVIFIQNGTGISCHDCGARLEITK